MEKQHNERQKHADAVSEW